MRKAIRGSGISLAKARVHERGPSHGHLTSTNWFPFYPTGSSRHLQVQLNPIAGILPANRRSADLDNYSVSTDQSDPLERYALSCEGRGLDSVLENGQPDGTLPHELTGGVLVVVGPHAFLVGALVVTQEVTDEG